MKKSLPERIAIMRFKWHANMIDIVNVANQLHLLSDDKAERFNRNHVMIMVTDIIPRIDKRYLREMSDKIRKERGEL